MSLFRFRRIKVMVTSTIAKSLSHEIHIIYHNADPPGPSGTGEG
jgi:hypothetical protein